MINFWHGPDNNNKKKHIDSKGIFYFSQNLVSQFFFQSQWKGICVLTFRMAWTNRNIFDFEINIENCAARIRNQVTKFAKVGLQLLQVEILWFDIIFKHDNFFSCQNNLRTRSKRPSRFCPKTKRNHLVNFYKAKYFYFQKQRNNTHLIFTITRSLKEILALFSRPSWMSIIVGLSPAENYDTLTFLYRM